MANYNQRSLREQAVTDPRYDAALGRVPGAAAWNKFGYNLDIDIGTEAIWTAGGLYVPLYAAETLSVVSTSANDAAAGTGARQVRLYGVDDSFASVTEDITLNGTTPVVTTNSYYGINRAVVISAGSGMANAGAINITAPVAATTQAQIAIGDSITNQAAFHVCGGCTFLADWLQINAEKTSGGSSPKVTFKGYVYSHLTGAKMLVFRQIMDTAAENTSQLAPSQPFAISEKSVLWFEASTDTNDTAVSCRFSGVVAS